MTPGTERVLQSRYRLLYLLGSGGLGSVYLCDDLRLSGKQWAVKQLHPPDEERAPRFRKAFGREAEILARLRHPNLPVVVDYFEEDGDCYLVMERVEGENLAQHVRRTGPMGEREAFEHGRILLDILEFLHRQDPPVVFRDLKPENVMRTPDGALRLVDFGLCRPFRPGGRVDTVPSGSVGYAPPEQWEENSPLDGRSDLYSWGATMLFLLTGRKPATVAPMPAPEQSRVASPGGERILAACLQAEARDRYPSATALKREVARLLEDLPPSPPPGTGARGAGGKAGAFRGRALAWILAVVLLVVLSGWAWRTMPRHDALPGKAGDPAASPRGVLPYQWRSPADPEKEEGRGLLAAARPREALAILERVAKRLPGDAEARILRENARVLASGVPTLTLPFVGSFTGVDGPDAFSQLHGVALAQEQVNARGGVRGRPVVVGLHDDGSSTTQCLEIGEKLVRDPGVLLVIGPYNSQRTMALAPLFNTARIPLLAPVASAAEIWDRGGPYLFSASDSTDRRIRALARYLVQRGYRRVGAVVDETSRISREMAQTMTQELATLLHEGGPAVKLVPLPSYQEDSRDFSAQVEALRAAPPDVVFLCDYRIPTTARFARALRAAGLDLPLCAQTIPFAPDLVDLGGAAVDGLIMPAGFHPDQDTAGVRSFVTPFRATFGDVTPTHLAANTYDAFNAALEALQRASTREGVREFLRASGTRSPPFSGVTGPYATGRCLDARPVRMVEVRAGRYRLLEETR